jgi:hypothetical protein
LYCVSQQGLRSGETPDFGELSRAVPHLKMQSA